MLTIEWSCPFTIVVAFLITGHSIDYDEHKHPEMWIWNLTYYHRSNLLPLTPYLLLTNQLLAAASYFTVSEQESMYVKLL